MVICRRGFRELRLRAVFWTTVTPEATQSDISYNKRSKLQQTIRISQTIPSSHTGGLLALNVRRELLLLLI